MKIQERDDYMGQKKEMELKLVSCSTEISLPESEI